MSECGSCKLVSMGKGRTALCYDCLEAQLTAMTAENAKLETRVEELEAAIEKHKEEITEKMSFTTKPACREDSRLWEALPKDQE